MRPGLPERKPRLWSRTALLCGNALMMQVLRGVEDCDLPHDSPTGVPITTRKVLRAQALAFSLEIGGEAGIRFEL